MKPVTPNQKSPLDILRALSPLTEISIEDVDSVEMTAASSPFPSPTRAHRNPKRRAHGKDYEAGLRKKVKHEDGQSSSPCPSLYDAIWEPCPDYVRSTSPHCSNGYAGKNPDFTEDPTVTESASERLKTLLNDGYRISKYVPCVVCLYVLSLIS